ncbi:hypothetical protein [Indioceanicola profundi]|uniref:hypothetical protein n=1 Tax=Indioceanicola profundi TaxID=2220096 RepID=UPI0013C52172|nr:hypothetical protein [Indioceanicola profundi]
MPSPAQPFRRRLLRMLALAPAAGLLGAPLPALAAAIRPPDNHFRLTPLMLPVAETGPFTYARVVADLVLDLPTSKESVQALQPKLVGTILREGWDLPLGHGGRVGAEGAQALKTRILRISQDVVGRQVQDVLIVSLIVG